jgi:hypothetical protein
MLRSQAHPEDVHGKAVGPGRAAGLQRQWLGRGRRRRTWQQRD